MSSAPVHPDHDAPTNPPPRADVPPDGAATGPGASAGRPGVVWVPVASLDCSVAVRTPDPTRVHALAEVLPALPPVLVHRASRMVLDGHACLAAAVAAGRTSVPVVYYDGDLAEGWAQAFATNRAHGLAFTRADRRAAADLLLRTTPDWSNRRIAAAAGVSETAVRRLRSEQTGTPGVGLGCPGASPTQLDTATRLARNGTRHPVNPGARRAAVQALLTVRPDLSDRAIGRLVGGVSPTTVAKARRALPPSPTGSPRRAGQPGRARGVWRAGELSTAWLRRAWRAVRAWWPSRRPTSRPSTSRGPERHH